MSIKPTKQEQHSLEMRKRILDTARQLFFEYGYENTSMKDIAASLGVTTGALYHHWKSKEDLLKGILAQHQMQFGTLLKQYQQSSDPLKDLHNFLSSIMVDRVFEDGKKFTQYRVLNYMRFEHQSQFDECVACLTKKGLDMGQFRPQFSCDQISDLLTAIYRGTLYQYSVSVYDVDLHSVMSNRIGLAISALSTGNAHNSLQK